MRVKNRQVYATMALIWFVHITACTAIMIARLRTLLAKIAVVRRMLPILFAATPGRVVCDGQILETVHRLTLG